MGSIREIMLPDLNGGLNANDPEYGINDNQSPDMLNMWFRGKALSKRDGQVLAVSGLDGEVHQISPLFCGFFAVHAGSCLYKWRGDHAQMIKSGISQTAGAFCAFGDSLYYLDGEQVWQIFDDYTVAAIEAYVPVVKYNALPDLSGGEDGEAYNLIGAGFTVKYNGSGTASLYSLPQTALDATTLTGSVNAQSLTEGVHFSVNRAAGTVNFSGGSQPHGAPAAGTNNVWITAYKTVEGSRQKIAGCRVAVPFGGEAAGVHGGTRVFVMRNAVYPLSYWRSDLGQGVGGGMRYFPDTSEEHLDQNSQPITAAAKMGGELVIFKERSIFSVGYTFDGMDVFYPVKECHSAMGCDMPGSVQLVDNRLVFAHSKSGVHMLNATSNEIENAVKPLSANIGRLLLREKGLEQACSADFGRYYWLCAGGCAYLWDYEQTPYYNYADYEKAQRRLAWYRFNNIFANVLCIDGETLYHGCEAGIVRFSKNKNDFSQPYTAYFTSKAFDLKTPDTLKTFLRVYPSFASEGNIKADVFIGSDRYDVFLSRHFDIKSFSWQDLNWGAFTFDVIKFARTFAIRLGLRRAAYLQIRVSGSEKDRDVGISGLRIEYFMGSKIRR